MGRWPPTDGPVPWPTPPLLATPALNSLASKSVGAAEQGTVLGVTQSVASLARAVGPFLTAVLIDSPVAQLGADKVLHYMSDHSLFVTFWTGSAIMFVAFLLAVYFLRAHADDYRTEGVAEAV